MVHSQLRARPSAELPPSFSCRRFRTDSGAVHVVVGGELDIAAAPAVDRALRRACASSELIALDLRALEFIDCSGMHLIVEADRRIRRAGGRLVVVRRRHSEIDWLFTLVGVDRVVELADQPPGDPSACLPVSAPYLLTGVAV